MVGSMQTMAYPVISPVQAEAYLTEALEECHPDAHKNREYVLPNPRL